MNSSALFAAMEIIFALVCTGVFLAFGLLCAAIWSGVL